MLLNMFKSKIHRATVTQADLEYKGSLTLDPLLMEAAGMLEFEQVVVLNINNGQRFTTYIITGERDSGVVCLNGAAARLGQPGDKAILITYALMTEEEAKEYSPTIVLMGDDNEIESVENPKD